MNRGQKWFSKKYFSNSYIGRAENKERRIRCASLRHCN